MKWFLWTLIALVPLTIRAGLLLSFPPDAAPNYFVATNGTAGGTGRLSDPISYSTLLTNISVAYKSNNAVFWMRGGYYTNLLNSTPGFPNNSLVSTGAITVRPYPKENPVLRCGLLIGSNITLFGLTLWSPMTSMILTDIYPGGEYSVGLNVTGASNRIIGNNIVGHGGGVLAYTAASNLIFYGNVVLASGVEYTNPTPRNSGHGIYMQNKDGTKTVNQNHIMFACSDVATFHGTSAAYENNVYFQSNFVSGSDMMGIVVQSVSYDFEANKGDNTSDYGLTNFWVTDNLIVQDANIGSSSALKFGRNLVGATNYDTHFDRNTCLFSKLDFGDFDPVTGFSIRSNLLWSVSITAAAALMMATPTLNYVPGSIDWNTWHYTGGNVSHPFEVWTNLNTYQITVGAGELTSVGTTATVTHTAHGFRDSQRLQIQGAAQTEYNGFYVITVTGDDTFTYTFAGSATSPATGTIYATVAVTPLTTLGQWQDFVLGESNSTYSTIAPTTVIAKVWPNALRDAYDPWWGDVAIWNPNRASNNVFVALSGLPSGTGIKVYYTGDILGSPILTTTYDGSGITIPMTNLPTYQPNDPTWPKLPQPTNGASFRVFLTDFANSASVTTLRVGTLRGP